MYESGIRDRNTTIIEFDSLEAAKECHSGSACQAALQAIEDGVMRYLPFVKAIV